MAQECCPVNTVFIDANGNFDDIGFGTGVLINFTPSMANMCTRVILGAAGWMASALLFDPPECPCCAAPLEWSSFKQTCMNLSGQTGEPIPCIVCVCPDPVDFTCDNCDSKGRPISFILSTHTKNCIDCEPQEENIPKGRMRCFMPSQYLDPFVTNFKLRNTNFI